MLGRTIGKSIMMTTRVSWRQIDDDVSGWTVGKGAS